MSRSLSPTDRRSPSPAAAPVERADSVDVPAKRKRSDASRSPSPPSRRRARPVSRSPPPRSAIELPQLYDRDPARRRERERQMAIDLANAELQGDNNRALVVKPDPREEMKKMASTKGGGAYIPPHRLRAMLAEQAEQNDSASAEYQRLTWEALRKSLNGLINKVNTANIKLLVPEIFGENLIRGRGLFARSIMRAQASSLPFTPIFASLVAIINSKLPQVGSLLLNRLIHQFRRSYKRNDKATMIATISFIAQLVNQRVAPDLLALEILDLLLDKPTDDSVEIAVSFMREVGAFLSEEAARPTNDIFDVFRSILNGTEIEKRVQYMVEVLFQLRKDKFKDHPIIPEGLDLVEEDDLITHEIGLEDVVQVEEMLNVFKFDPDYEQHEDEYAEMKHEILGDSDEEDDESAEEGDTEDSDADEDEDETDYGIKADGTVDVHDQTGANLVNLRRTIYLTIMSALDFEEAVHKLLKIHLPDHQAGEMCNMIIECCSQERTYSKFYGLMGERFAKLNRMWTMAYEQCFQTYYETIHRYETNRLRNIARFFGHLLATDAIAWSVFDVIRMNEDDTTSSSRIFVKILFQEVVEGMGLKKLKERLAEESMRPYLTSIFPIDNPKNTRFSINFFTSIGLGAVTEEMREHLKRAPQLMLEQRRQLEAEDSSDSDSTSSTESSLSSSSLSSSSADSRRGGGRRRGRSRSRSYSSRSRSASSRSRSPPRRDGKSSNGRRRSLSDSRSRSRSRSVSPPPARRRGARDDSRSASPPPRRRYDSRSPPPRRRDADSRSPPPRRRSPSPPPRRRSPSPVNANGGGGGAGPYVHPSRLALQQGGGGGGGRGPNDRYGGGPPRGGFQNREAGIGYGRGGGGGRGGFGGPPRDNGYASRGGVGGGGGR